MLINPSLALALKLAIASSLSDVPAVAADTLHLRHHHSHSSHSSHDNGATNSAGDAQSPFDFYVYSMTYQPEFCRENSEKFTSCHHPNTYWEGQLTIHGLWPQRMDGTWPSECTGEKLAHQFYISPNTSTSILDAMEEKWPNIKAEKDSSSHTQFWEHEWSKHGTCSGLGQFDYFSSALGLLLDTPAVVKEGYGSSVLKSELLDGYGGEERTALVCKSGYLSEVRACFEKREDGLPGERMDCPAKVLSEGSCGDSIEIASFGSMVSVE